MRTTKHGKPCYKWGTMGKAFAYEPGSAAARSSARQRAMAQGRMTRSSKKAKRG